MIWKWGRESSCKSIKDALGDGGIITVLRNECQTSLTPARTTSFAATPTACTRVWRLVGTGAPGFAKAVNCGPFRLVTSDSYTRVPEQNS